MHLWYAHVWSNSLVTARGTAICALGNRRLTASMGLQVPESGKIYSFNEGNYMGWEQGLQDYMMSLKDADKHGGKPYSARYTNLSCLWNLYYL